jgi:hypothetical protein
MISQIVPKSFFMHCRIMWFSRSRALGLRLKFWITGVAPPVDLDFTGKRGPEYSNSERIIAGRRPNTGATGVRTRLNRRWTNEFQQQIIGL